MRIEELYDTLFDEEAFSALPGQLAQLADGRSAIVGWIYGDGSQSFLGSNGYFRTDDIARYLRDYAAEDPWTLANISDFRPNRLVDNIELVPDERYAKSRLYNEFFRSIGDDTFRALSISSQNRDGKGSLAIHRGKSARGFSEAGKRALERIAPHVGRVIALRAQLDRLGSGLLHRGVLADQGPVAGIIVDSKRILVEANSGGEQFLRQGDILALKLGRVIPVCDARAKVEEALALATMASPSSSMLALHRAGTLPLTLDVVPIPLDATKRGALLLIRDPFAMADDTEQRLITVFGLSRAQAAVALGLAQGRTIEELAEARKVSRETVKVQVRDVAARLGCRRQAEIAAVVRAIGVLSKTQGLPCA